MQKIKENQNNLQKESLINQHVDFSKKHNQQTKIENCSLIQTQQQNPQIFLPKQKKMHYLDQSQINLNDFYKNDLVENLNLKKNFLNNISQKDVSMLSQQTNVDNLTQLNYQNCNIIGCGNSILPENNLSSVFQTTQSKISNLLSNQFKKDNKQTFDQELNEQKQFDINKTQYLKQNFLCINNETQKDSNLSTTSQLAKFLQNSNLLHNVSQEQITSLLNISNTGKNNYNLVGINSENNQNKKQQTKNQQFSQLQPLQLKQSNQQSTVQLQKSLSNLAVAATNSNSNVLIPNVNTNSDLNNDSSVNAQLIALYNRFNLINSPLIQQNAAAIYARTFDSNISSLQKNCMFFYL